MSTNQDNSNPYGRLHLNLTAMLYQAKRHHKILFNLYVATKLNISLEILRDRTSAQHRSSSSHGQESQHQCTRLVTQVQGRQVSEIFGFPDDLKFHSSMTLFALAVPADLVFRLALEKYFDGKQDKKTEGILKTVKLG
jgi:hypothetical protein